MITTEDIERWRRSLAMAPTLPAGEVCAILDGAEELLEQRARIDGQLAAIRFVTPALDSLIDQARRVTEV